MMKGQAPIIGITGQSGAGKTTICNFFEKEAAYDIINCDDIAHSILLNSTVKANVLAAFPTVSTSDGEISRKALGKIVFSDKKALEFLNSLTHPSIIEELGYRINAAGFGLICLGVIIDAPTLFESGADKLCDITVGVVSELPLLTKRLCERDNISEEEAVNRIKRQHDIDFFEKNCDYIIKNNGEISELENQARELLLKVKSLKLEK